MKPSLIVLVLQDIRSIHNVGSIFRTADAAGVSKIYLTGITPSPVDRFGKYRSQFVKVSLGAERTVAWEKKKSTAWVLKNLKKENFKIFAVEQSLKSIPYFKLKPKIYNLKPIALVFGNEPKGLPNSTLIHADAILEIPVRGAMIRHANHPKNMNEGKESLNVSVSTGIVIFYFMYLH